MKQKRLNVEMSKELHDIIKKMAKDQQMTIRRWVLRAIIQKIKLDKSTE